MPPDPTLERFIISQSAIIRDTKGCVLILKSPACKWLLPGGCINVGENSRTGLVREVKEETSLDIDRVLSIIDADTWYDEKGAWCTIAFECSVKDMTPIVLSHEHTEYWWVSQVELRNVPFWHPHIGNRIQKVFDKYSKNI